MSCFRTVAFYPPRECDHLNPILCRNTGKQLAVTKMSQVGAGQSHSLWRTSHHIMDKTNHPFHSFQIAGRRRLGPTLIFHGLLFLILVSQAIPVPAQASMFKGETLDKVADVLAWIVLIVAPVVAIIVFWIVHILPERIAERRKHPQAKAIQTLCLLSLVFGGLLWPIAWLWAYSKPVLYKLAYGTDTVEPEHGDKDKTATVADDTHELQRLRARLAELEAKPAEEPAAVEGGQV